MTLASILLSQQNPLEPRVSMGYQAHLSRQISCVAWCER